MTRSDSWMMSDVPSKEQNIGDRFLSCWMENGLTSKTSHWNSVRFKHEQDCPSRTKEWAGMEWGNNQDYPNEIVIENLIQ